MTVSDCPCPNPRSPHLHGTRTRYRQCGCRCNLCVTVSKREYKALRYRWSQGKMVKVSAAAAREHIFELTARGISVSQIAYRSGVRADVLADIRDGITKRCYPGTSAAVLAVPAILLSPSDDPRGFVNSVGTKRRIRALMAIGWTSERIAEASGTLTRLQVTRQLRAERHRVRVSAALAIVRAYDALWYRQPVPATPAERLAIERVRAYAKRMRWGSPLAWDEDIDDPDATSSGQVEAVA